MNRPPVSVVLIASGASSDLRACLDTLRPGMGVRDEAICVVQPDDRERLALLRKYSWVRPVSDDDPIPGNRWGRALAEARHPIAVLLDGDVVLPAHFLDPLLRPFEDPAVVAAGPYSHASRGPQDHTVPDSALRSPSALRAYARQWRDDHRGTVVEVDRLGPICVAVRTAAVRGPLGGDGELDFDGLRESGRLVLVEEVLIGHVGRPSCALRAYRPASPKLISASMIVKDEERVIAESIAAVRPLVDEVVVYDTGSTDRTREIAATAGARVIEGYWNDHFSDARNRCISHCNGEWILVVDADEIAEGDPDQLRQALTTAKTDSLMILVNNAKDTSSNALWSTRLFRAHAAEYAGRLHEQVVDRLTHSGLVGEHITAVTITHSGYTAARMAAKDKANRNLVLARLAAEDPDAPVTTVVNLARSELLASNVDEAIAACRRGLARSDDRVPRMVLLTTLINACVKGGRLPEAQEALDELRAMGATASTTAPAEAKILLLEGEHQRAFDLLRAFPEHTVDDMLMVVTRDQLAELEIASLVGLNRSVEAAERLRERLRIGDLPVTLASARTVLEDAGSHLDEIAALFPHERLRSLLGPATSAPAELADELADALWQQHHGDPIPLALGARIGPRLSPSRALEWSARLRANGRAEQCPLIALTADVERAPRERVQAAAIALATFADERAPRLLEAALAAVSEAEHHDVINDLRLLLPELAAALEPA